MFGIGYTVYGTMMEMTFYENEILGGLVHIDLVYDLSKYSIKNGKLCLFLDHPDAMGCYNIYQKKKDEERNGEYYLVIIKGKGLWNDINIKGKRESNFF